MQDHVLGPSPNELISAEIEEIGQRIAQRLQVDRSLDRSRRSRIRALLREAFHTTQVDCGVEELRALLERLREESSSLRIEVPQPLDEHLEQVGKVSRFDENMGSRPSRFEARVERLAERVVEMIEGRIEKTLHATTGEGLQQTGEARPLHAPMELMELVVKKQS